MTPFEATKILEVDERVSSVSINGWAVLREELICIKLELESLVRKAKKSHHPDRGGEVQQFHNVDDAARYLAETDINVLVDNFLPSTQNNHASFCLKCEGTTKFRGSICPACGGRGTVVI